ncbi:hypothetical protein K435DRAFT_239967 [Dendrothele bispora CBS 962.96]|uniref:Heterokaryon incompatibility domain-containing protein n=1 Tax=Dendrothele bispora (strain CBS 962.96) TaxID=1314807 RepID=A0A4S8MMH0_DENBC|nr:hypothetical protein K435DRAFT_239967 [Dendrothele bispora CBS 962.96]
MTLRQYKLEEIGSVATPTHTPSDSSERQHESFKSDNMPVFSPDSQILKAGNQELTQYERNTPGVLIESSATPAQSRTPNNADITPTGPNRHDPLISEDEKNRMFQDILSTVKKRFHDRLQKVRDMEDISESTGDQKERDSAPENARRMDGAMVAIEGLLGDPIRMFQDVVVKHLFEAGKRAEEAGNLSETKDSPKPLPTFPEPTACVFERSFSMLNDVVIDISKRATPCRFRFIDCIRFVNHQTLRIIEYDDMSNLVYAATSYIWRGVIGPPTAAMAELGTFAVEGAIDGDPISIDVLHHACKASLLKDIPLLWLDRLCIMQTNREDKAWQIQQMYRVYAFCKECFVLPGGTRRLASLEEPTMWIHRGWTLQEAVAPKSVSISISWQFGEAVFHSRRLGMGTTGTVEEVVPGQSAYTKLSPIVNASVAEDVEFRVAVPESYRGKPIDVSICIFGSNNELGWRHAFALSQALKPNDAVVDPNDDKKRTALWRSAQMRTSSRPVDMVFSIMGLFGVTLDPKAFKSSDRLGATIAFAREILKQNGRPNWFSISLSLPPNPSIRSFPAFPKTNEAGVAMYKVDSRQVEAAELMGDVDGWLGTEGIPGGEMDEHGFLTVVMKSASVKWTDQVYHEKLNTPSCSKQSYDTQLLQFHDLHCPPFITDQDGRSWEVLSSDSPSSLYVALLGRMYTRSKARYFDPRALIKGIFLEKYEEGKFRRFTDHSYFVFNIMSYRFEGWEERVFTI